MFFHTPGVSDGVPDGTAWLAAFAPSDAGSAPATKHASTYAERWPANALLAAVAEDVQKTQHGVGATDERASDARGEAGRGRTLLGHIVERLQRGGAARTVR